MGILFDEIAIIVNGSEHRLDGKQPYAYLASDGLGAAPLHRLAERGPQQHGDTDLGYRLDPRIFSLVLLIEADDESEFWNQRADLISYFAPYHAPILKFVLKNGATRYIDAYHVGDLIMSDEDFRGRVVKTAVRLKAPDPTFYDPEVAAVTFALGGGGDAFVIPHEVPHGVGASTIDQVNVIAYTGTWLSYPHLIRITGPIEDCVITNEATGEKLDFTGVTIAGGDYYDIDCRYGQKTVVDSSGVNKIADLTSDSDLATFHLAPDSADAPGGVNSIRVTGSSVTEATGVAVNYFNRYLGI